MWRALDPKSPTPIFSVEGSSFGRSQDSSCFMNEECISLLSGLRMTLRKYGGRVRLEMVIHQ
jgi:hypothetical protein